MLKYYICNLIKITLIMLQRIQTLFLLIVIIAGIVLMFVSAGSLLFGNGILYQVFSLRCKKSGTRSFWSRIPKTFQRLFRKAFAYRTDC